jgi:hypothetical protein
MMRRETPPDASELTPEMAELLRAGARNSHGFICTPGSIQKHWKPLRELERLGYMRFLGFNPWITEQGRAVIGEPTEMEADYRRRVALFAELTKRRALVPRPDKDPRTDFDYRSFKSCGYVCVLAVRLPDERPEAHTIKVGRPGSKEHHYFGQGNSIIQQESEGRFLLAVMPGWLQRRWEFLTHPMALPDDGDFTDEEKIIWRRLTQICISINSRIRNAGRAIRENRPYGETA